MKFEPLRASSKGMCRPKGLAINFRLNSMAHNAIEIRDYNGTGKWSVDSIRSRYHRYCEELRIENPLDLTPTESESENVKWIYPVMDKVIAGIEQGDAACREIGVEFLEEDGWFPFSRVLRSNTARALRRGELSADQEERIRKRIIQMLIDGDLFRGFKEYAKLLKSLGFENHRAELENGIDRSNGYVMRWYTFINL